MQSIFRQFQQRVQAGTVNTIKDESVSEKSRLVRQQKNSVLSAAIAEDLKILKGINSRSQRAEHKKILVGKYSERVKVLCSEGDNRSEILGLYLVWLFDAGMIAEAVEFSGYCMENDVQTPAFIKRDTITFIAEALYEWAERQHSNGVSAGPYFENYLSKIESMNVPDEVKGKYFRLSGMYGDESANYESAVSDYEKALKYGAKVNTKLEKARDELKKNG